MQHRPLRRGLIATVSALSITALLFAGSVSAAGMDLAADTSPPQILSVKPLAGSTDAAPNTNIGVQFNEPMSKTATEAAFKVGMVDGARVSGTFEWIGDSIVFDPTTDLVPGAKYVAIVGTGATDLSGNGLEQARTWEFKVAGTPTTSPIATNRTTTAPRAVGIFTGTLRSGNAGGLGVDDNTFFEVDGAKTWDGWWTTSRLVRSDWYGVLPAQHGLKSLKVTYRGSASAKCSQAVSIYNWRTGIWEKLANRITVDQNEVTVEASPVGSPGDYVSASSTAPDVLVRVQCERYDGWGFTSRGDLLSLTFEV